MVVSTLRSLTWQVRTSYTYGELRIISILRDSKRSQSVLVHGKLWGDYQKWKVYIYARIYLELETKGVDPQRDGI
jgi:hypothetical protein